jgi:ribosome maturation factor RimP
VATALDTSRSIPGNYTLEVSSPGVERRLRTPEHFSAAVGEVVSIRTVPGSELRRLQGRLTSVDSEGFEVESGSPPGGRQYLRFADVERARTVFNWGPTPAPGHAPRPRSGATPGATSTERVSTP